MRTPFLIEKTYKPGYVVNDHLSRLPVTRQLKRPTLKRDGPPHGFVLVLLRVGFTSAHPVTRMAVSSYLAVSPLPADAGGSFLLH